jgi:hypothetical protein
MNRRSQQPAGRGAFAALFLAIAAAPPVQAQAPAKPLASVAPRGAQVQQAQADVTRAKPAAAPKRDVFAPHSWLPPPPPPPKPVPPVEIQGPPAPPPPPPLTFAYLGQLDVQGEPTVYFLAHGERVLLVKIGDTIDGVYRLLAQEGSQLALVYLPLNAKQLLPLNRPQS